MATKIRLKRRGRKKLARYDVVVADSRAPRDGRYIERLGVYDPGVSPARVELDAERTLDWLMKGAQPTDTTRRILSTKGLMLKKHLQIGVSKGAISQEEADKRYESWVNDKETRLLSEQDALTKKKADEEKVRLDAEKKIKEAKAEALREKRAKADAALAAEIRGDEAEEPEEEVSTPQEATVEEAATPGAATPEATTPEAATPKAATTAEDEVPEAAEVTPKADTTKQEAVSEEEKEPTPSSTEEEVKATNSGEAGKSEEAPAAQVDAKEEQSPETKAGDKYENAPETKETDEKIAPVSKESDAEGGKTPVEGEKEPTEKEEEEGASDSSDEGPETTEGKEKK